MEAWKNGGREDGEGGGFRVTSCVFWLPKAGHQPEEYEDAFAVAEGGVWPFAAAVADGATESAYAGPWARRLAQRFVAEHPVTEADFEAGLVAWRAAWAAEAARRTPSMPWYAAAKLEEGAHAALLGLTLEADGSWRALAIGDCCLFHLADGAERLRWPIAAPEDFTQRPFLVGSRPDASLPGPRRQAGTWRPGDAFLLATDALAAWLMHIGPGAAASWSAEAFQAAVADARAAGRLRNDDVTLLRLHVQHQIRIR